MTVSLPPSVYTLKTSVVNPNTLNLDPAKMLIDWLVKMLINWLVDMLFNWLVKILIDRLVKMLINWLAIDISEGREEA